MNSLIASRALMMPLVELHTRILAVFSTGTDCHDGQFKDAGDESRNRQQGRRLPRGL
jgi:hypothetical protein